MDYDARMNGMPERPLAASRQRRAHVTTRDTGTKRELETAFNDRGLIVVHNDASQFGAVFTERAWSAMVRGVERHIVSTARIHGSKHVTTAQASFIDRKRAEAAAKAQAMQAMTAGTAAYNATGKE